jgi:hypothetical protein
MFYILVIVTYVGIIMKKLEEFNWDLYSQSRIICCFFFTKDSRSKLGVEVLASGGVGS